MLKNRIESRDNHEKAMQKLNAILDKINLMQKPIFPNIEHSQQNNSTDSENSEDNHEESLHSAKDQVMKISNLDEDDMKEDYSKK